MYTFVITLHVFLCLSLIFIILMQPGKGADVSSAFGGGASSQLFGASGPGNFLTRGTGAIATLFMVTSITLALYSTEANMGGSDASENVDKVIEEGQEGEGFGAPAGTAPAPAPGPAAPAIAPEVGEPPPAPPAPPAP